MCRISWLYRHANRNSDWCSTTPQEVLSSQHIQLALLLPFLGVAVQLGTPYFRCVGVEVAETSANIACWAICKIANSGFVRPAASSGNSAPNFSAKYNSMEPDSNSRCGGCEEWSSSAEFWALGFISTKPLPTDRLANVDQPGVVFGIHKTQFQAVPPASRFTFTPLASPVNTAETDALPTQASIVGKTATGLVNVAKAPPLALSQSIPLRCVNFV